MDIDMSALRGLVREKEISFDLLVEAIEAGAAHRLPPHRGRRSRTRAGRARPEDRARHRLGRRDRRGRRACVARVRRHARRLRPDRGDDRQAGHPAAAARRRGRADLRRVRRQEGDIVAGVIQQGKNPRDVLVDLGKIEASCPPQEQVPGEKYVHGERLRCYVVAGAQGAARRRQSRCRAPIPNLVKKLFALEVPEIADGTVEIVAIAREAGHRTKIAVRSTRAGRQRQGRLHRPDGRRGSAAS